MKGTAKWKARVFIWVSLGLIASIPTPTLGLPSGSPQQSSTSLPVSASTGAAAVVARPEAPPTIARQSRQAEISSGVPPIINHMVNYDPEDADESTDAEPSLSSSSSPSSSSMSSNDNYRVDASIPWLWMRNRRHLGALARQGFSHARKTRGYNNDNYNNFYDSFFAGLDYPEGEIMGGILDGDDFYIPGDSAAYFPMAEDLVASSFGNYRDDDETRAVDDDQDSIRIQTSKRNIGSLARNGDLDRYSDYLRSDSSNNKRHIANAARLGMIPKRHIGSAMRNGGVSRFRNPFTEDKRHIGSIARNNGLSRLSHIPPSYSDDGVNQKRHIGALARNDALSKFQSKWASKKRHIGSVARTGGLPHRVVKRSTEESNSDVNAYSDEVLDAIQSLNLTPEKDEQFPDSSYGTDDSDENDDTNVDEGDGEGDEEPIIKRHIGSLARLGWLPPRRMERQSMNWEGDDEAQKHKWDDNDLEDPRGSGSFQFSNKRGLQSLARLTSTSSTSAHPSISNSGRRRGTRGLRNRIIRHPAWVALQSSRGVRSLKDQSRPASVPVRFRQQVGSAYMSPSFIHTRRVWKRSPDIDIVDVEDNGNGDDPSTISIDEDDYVEVDGNRHSKKFRENASSSSSLQTSP